MILFISTWSFSGSHFGEREEVEVIPVQEEIFPRLDPALYHAAVINAAGAPDPILAAYRNGGKEKVLSFFSALCGSSEFAALILNNASKYDIAPALAFALCWEESRYSRYAVNRNKNGSVDRGLFQLNDLSFPELSADDFFNPEINARRAMAHLRWCLDNGGSELSGLAMYNVGVNRVKRGDVPVRTLNYISRIVGYRNGIEALFNAEIVKRPDISLLR
ncbi:MAG: lytic transglycosylase domain-containing protein [Treponema sp.]|nr:lytic transglycosylase domain-containing protein [Treponema sp.]